MYQIKNIDTILSRADAPWRRASPPRTKKESSTDCRIGQCGADQRDTIVDAM
jgi:hypothetical protein